jgi:hypothetical protein
LSITSGCANNADVKVALPRTRAPRPPRAAPERPPRPAAVTRALVPLDTGKIREEALDSYRKTERELAKATEQLKRYQERDIPGFRAWCRRTFGKLFVQLSDLETSLHTKQAMAREIRGLAERFDLSDAEAYHKYLWRRDNPEAAEAEDRRFEAEERRLLAEAEAARQKRRAEAGRDETDTEEEAGPEPEDDWAEMEELFGAFLGGARRKRPRLKETDTATARELYRAIVRKLHPDHHGHMNEARKHLWDEAQTAWRNHDVETLKNVHAQCETEDIGLGAQTAVSTILQATRRIKEALRHSKRQIRQLTTRLEWNYATRKSNPSYARKVETVILDEIRLIRFQLDRLTRAFQTLEVQAAKKKRKKK